MNSQTIYCDVCRNITGKINTKRGFVCWECYGVEQKIFTTQDWRETTIDEYAKNNDMTLRDGETSKNLANRCKRLALEGLKNLK